VTTLAILRHSIRPARTRRAAWVMVCLWLLVALVPVRAWAAASMLVSMGDVPAGVTASAELPPCHAAAQDGAASEGDHRACTACVFCAPVLVPVVAQDGAALAAAAAPPAAMSGAAPEGALKALFRPPRG